jgi:iron complex transport system substrate-binding protein
MKPPPLPPKVVSLLPSNTEIVCALGMRSRLIGRSHECDYPPEVRSLPVCTRSRVDPAAPGKEIDRQVKAETAKGVSLYEFDVPLLRRLQPDVILTQGQCEVCAVSEDDLRRALAREIGWQPSIVALSPKRFTDLWSDMGTVARALQLPDEGRGTIRKLKERVAELLLRVCQQQHRPSVACVEWMDPLMAAGNWVPEMVELAGGQNLFGQPGEHSPWLDWQPLRQANPDILLLMPCGYDRARTRKELAAMTTRPGWSDLTAVKSRQVFLLDGNAYFNRPGPRLVDSVEMLAEIFFPMAFPKARYEGKGWERL